VENQRVLWVVFSITLFLLVVVVVGFVWFLPPEGNDPSQTFANATVVTETSAALDPIEWMRETSDVPGLSIRDDGAAGEGDLLLVVGATEMAGESTSDASDHPASSRSVSTIRVADPPAEDRPESALALPSASNSRSSAANAEAAPPAPRTKRVTQFWIQAGSFQGRSRAERANVALSEKGVTGLLTSVDVDGDTYYRVRVGPYDSRSEAQKFLGWLQQVDSFGSSYISEVYTTRTIN